jgi:hypothetical protein
VTLACHLPRETTSVLSAESGRIDTQVIIEHHRVYQHAGYWLSQSASEKQNDCYDRDRHPLCCAHSIDDVLPGSAAERYRA